MRETGLAWEREAVVKAVLECRRRLCLQHPKRDTILEAVSIAFTFIAAKLSASPVWSFLLSLLRVNNKDSTLPMVASNHSTRSNDVVAKTP
jgi:hypothetical protein